MRSLVIYYSKSGNTAVVANTIKKEYKSHVKEITDYTSHRSVADYLFPSLIDSASITPNKVDIDYYEIIFIGTPVWFGSITPAIKKIIDNIDFKNKNIILFNTMKEIGGDLAIKKMAKLVKKQNGNVVGAFSIITKGSTNDIVECTQEALQHLELTWRGELKMTSIIIYSSNKKIKFITKIISEKINSKIVEIKDLNKKSGLFSNIKNNINALRSNETEIKPESIDLSKEDLIIIGSPSTFGNISPAISTFIDKNSFKNKNVIIFTTTNSRQGYDVLNQMKKKIEEKEGIIVNSFIMRVNNKSDEELKLNTLKVIKQLDLDLYT